MAAKTNLSRKFSPEPVPVPAHQAPQSRDKDEKRRSKISTRGTSAQKRQASGEKAPPKSKNQQRTNAAPKHRSSLLRLPVSGFPQRKLVWIETEVGTVYVVLDPKDGDRITVVNLMTTEVRVVLKKDLRFLTRDEEVFQWNKWREIFNQKINALSAEITKIDDPVRRAKKVKEVGREEGDKLRTQLDAFKNAGVTKQMLLDFLKEMRDTAKTKQADALRSAAYWKQFLPLADRDSKKHRRLFGTPFNRLVSEVLSAEANERPKEPP